MLITIVFHENAARLLRRCQMRKDKHSDTKTSSNEQACLVTWVTKAPKYRNSAQYHTCSARCSMWFFVKDVTRQRHMNNFSALYNYRFVSTNTSLSPPVPPKKVYSRNEVSSLGRSRSQRGYVGRPSWKLHTKRFRERMDLTGQLHAPVAFGPDKERPARTGCEISLGQDPMWTWW